MKAQRKHMDVFKGSKICKIKIFNKLCMRWHKEYFLKQVQLRKYIGGG